MQLGMIGLGRMGGNIVRRLMRGGHRCVVWDRDPAPGQSLASEGATAAPHVGGLVTAMDAPRHIWIMLPAGEATETMIATLAPLLSPGDTIIDGGNTFWKDDIRRAAILRERGLHYVDVGTSGGVWGLERGYCMMIGGDKAVVEQARSDLREPGARAWRRFPLPATAMGAIRVSSRATSTPDRTAPAISSR